MIAFAAGTETGKDRSVNEDRIWISAAENACAVFDGQGAAGMVAGIAMHAFQRELETKTNVADPDLLLRALRHVNRQISKVLREDQRLRGSGTTVDLLAFEGNRMVALHVGDGRVYRLRSGALDQLSSDHTLVAEMVLKGELSADQARTHPRSKVINRVIMGTEVIPEILHSGLEAGDRFIACTDGVWRGVDEAALRALLLAMPSADDAVEAILRRAETSHDNASIIVATVG